MILILVVCNLSQDPILLSRIVRVFADGSVSYDQDNAGLGVYIEFDGLPDRYEFHSGISIPLTSTQAEYFSIIYGLEKLSSIHNVTILVYSDSQSVIFSVKRLQKCKNQILRRLRNAIDELCRNFLSQNVQVNFLWRPRTEPGIQKSDLLSRKGLQESMRGTMGSKVLWPYYNYFPPSIGVVQS